MKRPHNLYNVLHIAARRTDNGGWNEKRTLLSIDLLVEVANPGTYERNIFAELKGEQVLHQFVEFDMVDIIDKGDMVYIYDRHNDEPIYALRWVEEVDVSWEANV